MTKLVRNQGKICNKGEEVGVIMKDLIQRIFLKLSSAEVHLDHNKGTGNIIKEDHNNLIIVHVQVSKDKVRKILFSSFISNLLLYFSLFL